MYFKKLDLKLPTSVDLFSLKDNLKFSFGNHRLNYYKIADESVFSELIEKIPPDYEISFLEILGDVAPHTDSGVISCINFYIQSGHYRTDFWTPRPSASRIETIKTVNGLDTLEALRFDLNQLNKVDSFVAYDNDCYTLDISKIHSVHKYKIPTTTRIAIQFSWKELDYHKLNKHLEEISNEKNH